MFLNDNRIINPYKHGNVIRAVAEGYGLNFFVFIFYKFISMETAMPLLLLPRM